MRRANRFGSRFGIRKLQMRRRYQHQVRTMRQALGGLLVQYVAELGPMIDGYNDLG